MRVARPSTRGIPRIEDKSETATSPRHSRQHGSRTNEQRTWHGARRLEKGATEEGATAEAG